MKCSPAQIIKPSPLLERVHYRDGDTADIITVILRMDATADKWVDAEAAQCLRGANGYETLRNVWRFVKGNITYKADRPGREVVKSPAALFKIGKGDCKSFSIAEVALLRALGFKGIRYRFAAYGTKEFTHVYVVCKYAGRDVILDAVYSRFDEQDDRMTRKRDIPAALGSGISGLNSNTAPSSSPFILAALAFAWLAFRA